MSDRAKRHEEASRLSRRYREIFDERTCLNLTRFNLPQDDEKQYAIMAQIDQLNAEARNIIQYQTIRAMRIRLSE